MTDQTTFSDLGLVPALERALTERDYSIPTPIQARAIPVLMQGSDLMGCAQTGTGKTAAFVLPILHRLAEAPGGNRPGQPRVLILAPTRELAAQIGASVGAYGKYLGFTHAVIYGGVGQHPQVKALRRGIDILVATPGRLLDLLGQRHLRLDSVEVFVLDEADRMLDMGFAPDIKRLVTLLPAQRQSMLFSATMPPAIRDVARLLLRNPVAVEVAPPASTAEGMEQRVRHVGRGDKSNLLVHTIVEQGEGRVLVFSRTKHGSNKLAQHLSREGIKSDAIHGNKSQAAREKALKRFRSGEIQVLVATDVAARGIDVKGIELVINYDIPHEPESYVHRIGRTARAGAVGKAIAFCDPDERRDLRNIERLIRMDLEVCGAHPYALTAPTLRRESSGPRPAGNHRGRPGKKRPAVGFRFRKYSRN